jgi:hypothetical protein
MKSYELKEDFRVRFTNEELYSVLNKVTADANHETIEYFV